jgi:hypothetical protein
MQPLDLTDNQKAALMALVEHRALVRSSGGRWAPPGITSPSFGTKVISALMEMGLVVKQRGLREEQSYPEGQRFTPVCLADHLNHTTPAERALAVEKHIKGVP